MPVIKKPKKGAPKWMATFSDLVTLVLVFFVLLFSMSQTDAVKFFELQESFKGVGIGEKGFLSNDDFVSINLTTKDMTKEVVEEFKEKVEENKKQLDDLYEKIKEFVEQNEMSERVDVKREPDGVYVVILDNVLFDSGQAEIKPAAKQLISKLSEFFATVDNEIQIEGHTDNRPINSLQFPSNWELSSARASSVIRDLIHNHQLASGRFISIGFGDTQPIVPNDGMDNWQKNRRVVIYVKEK